MITDIRNLVAARRDAENDEGGFTLIELLIVIVVLGILAAIVVFAVQNLAGDSAKASCRTDAKTVEVAQEAKKAQTGTYALAFTDLVPTYLKSAPAAAGTPPRYVITLGATAGVANGKVLVQTPAMSGATTPVAPTDHNDATVKPCDTAV